MSAAVCDASIRLDPAAGDDCDPAASSSSYGGLGGGGGGTTSTTVASGCDDATHATYKNDLEDVRNQLKERDDRIASLERTRLKQDESIALLRSELGAVQIKHKEECYWLRLEVDNLRKDKTAVEDRMAELYRDMREIDNMNEADDLMASPVNVDAGYVLHLQSQLSKSMQTMGVLDNQIGMVKRSCDEVVKSLKEEIADVMDDKCRIEMELLNQLAVLDNEKRSLEDEYEREVHLRDERIRGRDGVIAKLRDQAEGLERKLAEARDRARTETGEASREKREKVKSAVDRAMMSCSAFDEASLPPGGFDGAGWAGRDGDGDDDEEDDDDDDGDGSGGGGGGGGKDGGGGGGGAGGNAANLRRRVEDLERDKSLLEDQLREERSAMAETSEQLRESLEEQDDRIERLTKELERAKAGGAEDAKAVLDAVHRDRDEALETLERVAEIWEKADESIQILDDIVQEIREYAEEEEDDDDENEDDDDGDDDADAKGRRKDDRLRTLSTLETATLVHSQIKVSLLLVELKLRNQLTTLRNDGTLPTALEGGGIVRATAGASGGPTGSHLDEESLEELIAHVNDVQHDTLDALEQVEQNMTAQIRSLERDCEDEAEGLRGELTERIEALIELQERHTELENAYGALERKLNDAEGEKKELGRRNKELKGRAANVDQDASHLRRDLERLERENADLSKDKKALDRTRKDLERTNRDLEKAVKELERANTDMEDAVDRYRKEVRDAKASAKESAKAAAAAKAEKEALSKKQQQNNGTPAVSIDPMQLKMFEKLQREIIAVVGRVKEKNEVIDRLTLAVEEHKVREVALKKELKRIMKRVKAIEEGSDRHSGPTSGNGRPSSLRRDRDEG